MQGEAWLLRYERDGQRAALQNAVQLLELAVRAAPAGSAHWRRVLDRYWRALVARAALSQSPDDIALSAEWAGRLAESYEAVEGSNLDTLPARIGRAEALLRLGRHRDALAAADEAIATAERIVGPVARCLQASALAVKATCQIALGEPYEALETGALALQTILSLSPDDRLRSAEAHATVLDGYVRCLIEVGQHGDAIRYADEAVHVSRRLSGQRLSTAVRLQQMAGLLLSLGKGTAALGPAREAVELYRTLSGSDPDTWMLRLITALEDLGHCFRLNIQIAAAEETFAERASLCRQVHSRTMLSDNDLAMALRDLGNALVEAGRTDAAIEAYREAVARWETLDLNSAEAVFAGDLKVWMANLLDADGRYDEAADVGRSALTSLHTQDGEAIPQIKANLAAVLYTLAHSVRFSGDLEEARALARDCVDQFQDLVTHDSVPARPDLATALTLLAEVEHACGDLVAAMRSAYKATESYRLLAADDRVQLPHLAGSLSNLGFLYAELEVWAAANSVLTESISTYDGLRTTRRYPLSRHSLELAAALERRATLPQSIVDNRTARRDLIDAIRIYEAVSQPDSEHKERLRGLRAALAALPRRS